MRVFYELVHTSCDVEIMKSGFDFDVLHPTWDESGRRKPKNARLVNGADGAYDAAVVSSGRGFNMVRRRDIPIIWKCFVDYGNWEKPDRAVLDRLSAWTALCVESTERFRMGSDEKTVVIEPGIDTDLFSVRRAECSVEGVLSVGNLLPVRPEKGPDVLSEVGKEIPISVIGIQNEGLSNVKVGGHAKSQEDLAAFYASYGAYFNPSGVICCAMLEAMVAGIPVVTMTPGNFVTFLKHNVNCMVALTPEQAVFYLGQLLENKALGDRIGRRGARDASIRFSSEICATRWRKLLESVVQLNQRP